jgi:hypothetical protein
MAGFVALQIVFDAVLLFAILFLFHYTLNRAQRKKDDENLLNSLEVEEIKQDLQELLVTLKQVGSEASEGIQQKVKEADAKTQRLKELLKKVDADLLRIYRLSEDVSGEKERLDGKWQVMQAARFRKEPDALRPAPSTPAQEKRKDAAAAPETDKAKANFGGLAGSAVAFSSEAVKEIYRLADTSVDVGEIARRTKLTRGEVQLILNLRTNRYTTPN